MTDRDIALGRFQHVTTLVIPPRVVAPVPKPIKLPKVVPACCHCAFYVGVLDENCCCYCHTGTVTAVPGVVMDRWAA